jgi:hypothetical protein
VLAAVDERQLVLVQRVQDELHADEGEDERQAVRQVDQAVHQVAEQEVQLAQAHEGEHVGREDQVRLLGEAVDGRDRVEREQQVGRAQGDDHQQHRRVQALAVLADTELEALPAVGHRQPLAGEPDDRVVAVGLVVVVADQLVRGEHQERAEDVEHPREVVDRGGAERDEDAAEDQGQDDAHHQRFLLVLPRHREAGHDDDEDEQVVDRQAVLGQPAGEELHAVVVPVVGPRPDAERDRQPHVHRQRRGALLERRLVRVARDHHDVEQQHSDGHRDGDRPFQSGNVH